jgi:preprotein translocase subunit SecG
LETGEKINGANEGGQFANSACQSFSRSKNSSVMLKKMLLILLFLFLVIFVFGYLDARAWRKDFITSGEADLKMAYQDYLKNGYVTNYSSRNYQVWLSTNVVTINSTQYQCFVTMHDERFSDAGMLAMTTNQVFIWLGNKHSPQIIDDNYRPPFFPPWY